MLSASAHFRDRVFSAIYNPFRAMTPVRDDEGGALKMARCAVVGRGLTSVITPFIDDPRVLCDDIN